MPESHFIDGASGALFIQTYSRDADATSRIVIVAPAFAEEMNRSRRSLHHLGIALSSRRMALVIPDLHGTGDSAGAFNDATWPGWQADMRIVIAWAQAKYGTSSISLLGIRLGSLLACDAATRIDVDNVILWQPVINCQRYMKEFLRMWDIANLSSSKPGTSAAEMLASMGILEVGGYPLTSELIAQIQSLDLLGSWPVHKTVHWFEIGTDLMAASSRLIDRLRAEGASIVGGCSDSVPFWRIQEVTTADDLLARTVSIFETQYGS